MVNPDPARTLPDMNSHVRSVALAGALATILASCGGGEAAVSSDDAPATSVAPSLSSSPSTGAADETSSAPAEDGQVAADPNAVLAPDFALALGDGGRFELSEEALPVYMVFWAEW